MSKTKKTKSPKPGKAASNPKQKKARADGTMSVLDAAARVLKEAGESMNCKAMTERMVNAGYWKTQGKTPAATLSSAIQREIKTKGKESRFHKADRGKYVLC